jgi:serine protease AprX
LEGEPKLTPDQIKARLMKTAYKTFPQSSTAVDQVTGQSYTSFYDIFTIGAGYLDVAAALGNHEVASGNAMSPTATYNAADGNVYLIFDPSSTWNKGTWSVTNVWGAAIVNPNLSIWGESPVWANSNVSGFRAVWGARGVWGTETDMGSSTVESTRGVWGTDAHTSDSDTVFTVTPR